MTVLIGHTKQNQVAKFRMKEIELTKSMNEQISKPANRHKISRIDGTKHNLANGQYRNINIEKILSGY